MNREKQIEYCKNCTKRLFDLNQGILCSLTNQKADFQDECGSFEIDKSKFPASSVKQSDEKKGRISYGFSPKQVDRLNTTDLTRKESYILAWEAAKELDWNIGYLSESGFVAYTKFSLSSWSEEVQVKIEVGTISIKSECAGNQVIDWGKNRNNIDSFFAAFKRCKEGLNGINIEEKYFELSNDFVNADEDRLKSPLDNKEETSGIFSLITPTAGYFITPIIVILNILGFAIMAISGVHMIEPSIESLILWGANFRPLTTEGELWRLFTSTFLHIGIFHLLMNMYALVYIGLLLEPYLGKARYLSAYLIAGISGSVASIYWNEFTVSAGASGAIFGMYGVFIALLTTRLIEKSARKSLLISIGIFVLYNLTNGLKEGIDNAAHIGGLLSGLIVGYSFYPGLVSPNKILKPVTIGILLFCFSLGSYLIVSNTKSDLGQYERDMQQFVKLEEKALGLYVLPLTSSAEMLFEIKNNGITSWEEGIKLLEKMNSYELPEALHSRNARLMEYCQLRIKSYKTIQKAILEDTDKYDHEINGYNIEIEHIINELSGSY